MSDVQINLTQPHELDEKPMRPKPVSTPESHFSRPISQSCMTPCNPQPSSKSNQVAADVWVKMELAFTVTNVASIASLQTEMNSLA
ncbi:uncharacterized protein VP01_76g7 [Puccinia sorghi]|uniref:Uncharacterized protein n=1 Tax=Puccinia sorghi TaxID=27349 RepID=A0A0L6UBI7_9BASI|nr:uncharacterized protein VP01_76g7 [Puccinia sorghi]